MAAMLLVAAWCKGERATPKVIVATVDHGLRAGSAEEALWVASEAQRVGLGHTILRWEGPKPVTGKQAAAREARYRLLEGLAAGLPAPAAIVLAHHLDDQAETFLMRLARGSGVDGLSGMLPVRKISRSGVLAVRPFLEIEKSRLVATLETRGIGWREDPSNSDPQFERVRLRRAMGEAAALGLTPRSIGESVRRLGRARAALEQATQEFIDRAVDAHMGTYASLPVEAYDRAPAELRLRLVQRLAARFGGGGELARTSRQEDLAERLAAGKEVVATLAGCQFRRTGGAIVAMREPGRSGLPRIELRPGEHSIWDGRFGVSASRSAPDGVTVAALTPAVIAEIMSEHPTSGRKVLKARELMRKAQLTLPAFWCGGRLLAVPALGRNVPELQADFLPL
jgi:tRNA(Ile)-lysidine synthase